MKEFDLYIKKLNAITKKYDSSLYEQQTDFSRLSQNIQNAASKAQRGLAIGNKKSIRWFTDDNYSELVDNFALYSYPELVQIWTALRLGIIPQLKQNNLINDDKLEKIRQWSNVSVWNNAPKPDDEGGNYGLPPETSLLQLRYKFHKIDPSARTKIYGNLYDRGLIWNKVRQTGLQINNMINNSNYGDINYRQTDLGLTVTLSELEQAYAIVNKSPRDAKGRVTVNVIDALRQVTGKEFTRLDLGTIFETVRNQSEENLATLQAIQKQAEDKIAELQDQYMDTPSYQTDGAKKGLRNMSLVDIYRPTLTGGPFKDLQNWAFAGGAQSWDAKWTSIVPTVNQLTRVLDGLIEFSSEYELGEQERQQLERAMAWGQQVQFIAAQFAELAQARQARLDQLAQRREQSAIDSAQRQEDKDAALVEALKQQQEALNKIKSQITDAANAINSREAAVPLTGYNPHRLVGGAKEVVSVKVLTYPAVRQAFEIIDSVKSAFVSGDDETWMNYLKNDIRTPIIDNLKETYVVLAANEKAFTKQVEPYSENGEITDTVSVIYGLDFTDISTVDVPPKGPIDQSLTYGLSEATRNALQLLAKDIPTIIRNNKKSDSFDWPPDIEINYDNLNNLADKRAEGLATSREKVLRSYYSDQMRTSTQQALSAEEEKRLAELAEEERLLFERNRLARELFRKYDLASMIAYQDFDEAVALWNEVKAPFLQTIELYKKTNASIMDIENLRSEYNSILYQNDTVLAAFGEWGKKQVEAIDQEIVELVNNEVDQLDQKTAMVAKKLQAIKSRADKSMRSFDQDDRAFIFGNTDIDTDEEPDLVAEFNAMRNSGVFQYMDKVQLEDIRNRVNEIQSDFKTVASKFKVYDDDFMVMDREINQEVTRLNSEPFVDASELEDLKNLYLEYFDERIDARNRLSRFTEETIVKDRFFKTSNYVGYLLQYKMIDFMNNDIGNLQKKLPPLSSVGWTSYNIHGVMNEEQNYENLKQNISKIYTIVDEMNSQISTLGASFGLPAGFENFVNGPHWNKLDDLFTDINMINGVRQGNSNDILAFRDYVSSFRNAIEYLDFLANEFKYQKNIEPHQNPVIQQALIYAEDLPFRNQFRWRTLNLLQSSRKATNEKGTGAYDLLLKGEYDRFLKPEFRNRQTWQGGSQSND